MRKTRMTERQATGAWAKGQISKTEYHEVLERIATARYAKIIAQKKNRRSMSSTKWTK